MGTEVERGYQRDMTWEAANGKDQVLRMQLRTVSERSKGTSGLLKQTHSLQFGHGPSSASVFGGGALGVIV
jgi:hypothetical protein